MMFGLTAAASCGRRGKARAVQRAARRRGRRGSGMVVVTVSPFPRSAARPGNREAALSERLLAAEDRVPGEQPVDVDGDETRLLEPAQLGVEGRGLVD